ncbi:MAG: 2-keto-4-pentenoate hydratase [Paracoccaceae bacterium]
MSTYDLAETTARSLLALWGTATQTAGLDVPDMAAASRVTASLRRLREARGERVVGRKIGFSNTSIWPRYNIDRPMWNYVWDSTFASADDGAARLDLARLPEPRLEPEIVFRLASAPRADMDEAGLLGCIGQVAHGFEIVQSVFPGWHFDAPTSAAAFGLHGALIAGPWHDIATDRLEWGIRLRDFTVELRRSGALRDTGHARNVLGGPVAALGHLVRALAADPDAPPLSPGEVITTGTLTDAHSVTRGEVWDTVFHGIPLDGLQISFI